MPCYHPITGYRTENGSVVFNQLARHGSTEPITVKCGQCIGCKLEQSRTWAMRCVHEASLYKRNCFVTLTFNDENLPYRNRLEGEHFVKFMKRLRKHAEPQPVRFYMGGEYGTLNDRPHFHAILFNWDWEDKVRFKETPSGETIYTSATLEKLWPWGYCSTAEMTFESAAYIARYCLQKRNGDEAEWHYKRFDELGEYQLTPEFNQMSRKPGLGADWYKFYKSDVHTNDYVIINGKETNVPKFYDKILKRTDPEMMREFKEAREWNGYKQRLDNTPERLAVKEKVTLAKLDQLKRGKI